VKCHPPSEDSAAVCWFPGFFLFQILVPPPHIPLIPLPCCSFLRKTFQPALPNLSNRSNSRLDSGYSSLLRRPGLPGLIIGLLSPLFFLQDRRLRQVCPSPLLLSCFFFRDNLLFLPSDAFFCTLESPFALPQINDAAHLSSPPWFFFRL